MAGLPQKPNVTLEKKSCRLSIILYIEKYIPTIQQRYSHFILSDLIN